MKQIGIALASIVLTNCTGRGGRDQDQTITCYTVVPDLLTPDPDSTDQLGQQTGILTDTAQSGDVDPEVARRAQAAIARERLRACWLGLESIAQRALEDPDGTEEERIALEDEHRAVLDELVPLDEVRAAVADHVQVAFEAAAYHVWRANAPITCYEPVMIDYKPTSSDQLTVQAAILAEMSDDGALEQEVVAQAQAAIERDIAFLSLSTEEVLALYQEIEKGSLDGSVPSFDEIELEVTPEAVEAAQFLVGLLVSDNGWGNHPSGETD
jgi:hypothetical protein